MTTSSWDLLRNGRIDSAIAQMRRAVQKDQDSSSIMDLGIAYLWTRKYEDALKHFEWACDEYPHSVDSFYEMQGTASWCLGDPRNAVEAWRDGLECEFSDPGGPITLPLLIYSASILQPRVCTQANAIKDLERRVIRSNAWPWPIVEFVAGKINERELMSAGKKDGGLEAQCNCNRAEFYVGIWDFEQGDVKACAAHMQNIADISRPEWSSETFFFGVIWSAEFFIARHFLEKSL